MACPDGKLKPCSPVNERVAGRVRLTSGFTTISAKPARPGAATAIRPRRQYPLAQQVNAIATATSATTPSDPKLVSALNTWNDRLPRGALSASAAERSSASLPGCAATTVASTANPTAAIAATGPTNGPGSVRNLRREGAAGSTGCVIPRFISERNEDLVRTARIKGRGAAPDRCSRARRARRPRCCAPCARRRRATRSRSASRGGPTRGAVRERS